MSHASDVLRPTRRQFVQGVGVAGLGLLAGCGRLPWQAGQPVKVFRIALLSTGGSGAGDLFREGLRDLGYVEGQNLVIDVRDAGGATAEVVPLALELVGLQPDV